MTDRQRILRLRDIIQKGVSEGLADSHILSQAVKVIEEPDEYSFDCTLTAVVRVRAFNGEEARKKLEEMQSLDVSKEFPRHDATITEVSVDPDALIQVFSINGIPTENA